MDSSKPPQAKPLRRKVHVVYYLSRGGGQMDHPHLLEGYLSAAQDGLRLRDFKRWLAVLRGKSMPNTFAWSYKRSYKNGFIWHDLGDNDLIQPVCKNEYVLMGSEIRELQAVTEKCKCGGVLPETKVGAEVGDIQKEPLNKSVLMRTSPKVVTKSSSVNTGGGDDQKIDGLMQIQTNSGRLVAAENYLHDNNKIMCRSGIHRGGGSSRSFNSELSAQKLLEEVKRPNNNYHDPKYKSYTLSQAAGSVGNGASRALIFRDCEIVSEDQEEREAGTNNIDELQGGLNEAARRGNIKKGNNSNSGYVKQATISSSKSRGDLYKDGIIMEDMMSDSHDTEDGTYIMDASTQTGLDSTRCSTDHHPEASHSAPCAYRHGSPGGSSSSAIFSGGGHGYVTTDNGTIRRVSSARFLNHHAGSGHVVIRGNLSKQLSKEFSDVEKAIMVNQSTSELAENDLQAHVSSSNNTSLHNHIGSPALSSCSAMSTRSTRFAREDNTRRPSSTSAASAAKNVEAKHQHHHGTHHKGSTAASSAPAHTLLKQLLTCGNADVVTESKPSHNHVIMSSNALSGLQTPSRMISTGSYQQGSGLINGDKKSNMWACKPGLMKRISTASSDNRSVISATVSDQASIRDTLDIISSPESVYSNRHVESIMRAHSLSSSVNFSASQLRAVAAGSTSPGVLSVGSSTSRRSSIRESDMNIPSGGDVEEGLREALRSHHVGVRDSPKMRPNKGNKNTILVNDILGNDAAHDCRKLVSETNNTTRGENTNLTSVSELHNLICNPSGTPTYTNNHNKVIPSKFATMPLDQAPNQHHHHHIHSSTRSCYTPQHHQSHHIVIPTHGPSRTPTRSSNLNPPNLAMLSKSLNSPSSSMFLKEMSHPPPSSSSYISSWKDLLWSPRYHSSHKEKEKRHMKP